MSRVRITTPTTAELAEGAYRSTLARDGIPISPAPVECLKCFGGDLEIEGMIAGFACRCRACGLRWFERRAYRYGLPGRHR